MQRKFLKYYLETGSKTEAAEKAGYRCKNRGDLCSIAIHLLKTLYPKVEDLMEQMGLDDVNLMHKLREGLEATEVKTASYEGTITDAKTYADYGTRHSYLQTALQLKGKLKNKTDIHLGGGKATLDLGLAPDLRQKLDEIYNH